MTTAIAAANTSNTTGNHLSTPGCPGPLESGAEGVVTLIVPSWGALTTTSPATSPCKYTYCPLLVHPCFPLRTESKNSTKAGSFLVGE